MEILVTGITGAVGSALAPQLLAAGHGVRGLSRRELDLSAAGLADVPVYRADAVSGAGLDRAMRGVDVAYYLIHSMEDGAGADFPAYEARAVENFAFAAQLAGVRRVVYLGGPVPEGSAPSPHLGSRLAVEQRLLTSTPEAITFRASIVIGTSSRSFRFLVRLIERMPVLPIPGWGPHLTSPIDERDVTAYLLAAATVEQSGRATYDIGGSEILSYRELLERIRDHMLVQRPVLGLGPLTLTPIAGRVAAIVAGEDPTFITGLMESLSSDLLPRPDHSPEVLGVRLHSLDSAIERALRIWEDDERLAAR